MGVRLKDRSSRRWVIRSGKRLLVGRNALSKAAGVVVRLRVPPVAAPAVGYWHGRRATQSATHVDRARPSAGRPSPRPHAATPPAAVGTSVRATDVHRWRRRAEAPGSPRLPPRVGGWVAACAAARGFATAHGVISPRHAGVRGAAVAVGMAEAVSMCRRARRTAVDGDGARRRARAVTPTGATGATVRATRVWAHHIAAAAM